MKLSKSFKRFVIMQKTENDLERQKNGQSQYKNIFSYYRFSRTMLKKQYKAMVSGNNQKNNKHENGN